MSAAIQQFPIQHRTPAENSFESNVDNDPAVRAKLAELQSWTICYNRELLRLTHELHELRAGVKAA